MVILQVLSITFLVCWTFNIFWQLSDDEDLISAIIIGLFLTTAASIILSILMILLLLAFRVGL